MAHLPTPPPQTARIWVGRNVRRYREEQGLNIGQLAERVSELGFPLERTQVSKIENGRTNVDVEKLVALAAALEVLPERLLRDPEQLDAYEFDRLYRYWFESLREWQRLKTLSDLLVADVIKVGARLPDDHPVLERFRSDLMATAEQKGWTLSVERISPDAPGYDLFIEGLMAGRSFEWSEEPKSIEESSEEFTTGTDKGIKGGK